MARVVQRLISHARADRSVADHRNRIAQPGLATTAQITRHGKAKCGRNRRRTMRRAEGVVRTDSLRLVKPDKPSFWRKCANAIPTPGQDLVRIALVRHVPDQLVFRRVEHRMQRRRQFDHAQPCAQMAPGFAYSAWMVSARNSSARMRSSLIRQTLQVSGHGYTIQHRRLWTVAQWHLRRIQNSREITNRAASRKASASSPYGARLCRASATNSRARAFAPSNPEERNERGLSCRIILIKSFTSFGFVARDIKNVVGDLERKAKRLSHRTSSASGCLHPPSTWPASWPTIRIRAPVLPRCNSVMSSSDKGVIGGLGGDIERLTINHACRTGRPRQGPRQFNHPLCRVQRIGQAARRQRLEAHRPPEPPWPRPTFCEP